MPVSPKDHSLSLVSLNIEGSKHLDRVLPFLAARRPDVVCLQELCERDIPAFEAVAGPLRAFASTMRSPAEGNAVMGIGIFSQLPLVSTATQYYVGGPGEVPIIDGSSRESIHETCRRMLLECRLKTEGGMTYTFVTTHFTFTPDGEADDFQRRDMETMLAQLESIGEFVLCGDLNAPRGKEIFSMLAERYTDAIPQHYTTSIDGALHRKGLLQLMVDGLFITPKYAAHDVQLLDGLSDHCAIVGSIARKD